MLKPASSLSRNMSRNCRIDNLFVGITFPDEIGQVSVSFQCVEKILFDRERCFWRSAKSVHVPTRMGVHHQSE